MANGSLTLLKLFGISVEIDWLFLLFILFCFLLLGATVNFLIIIVLFICVLLHEFMHSIVSIRNGVRIKKIILMPFGGMSVMDQTEIDPKVEFNISIAGPVTNLFIGGLFGIAVIFTPPGILTHFVQEVFLINILLGVSNIVPAFPMDGARVLRSYLQKKRGAYAATMAAVKVSQYCIVLILIASASIFFIPNSYSPGWDDFVFLIDLFIVVFLYSGTNLERESAIVKRDMEGITLSAAASGDYALIGYNASAKSLYPLMKSTKRHIILSKSPSGEYMMVDILNREAAAKSSCVKDMLIPIPNLDARTPIVDGMAKLEAGSRGMAAVTRKGKLVGLITASQVNAFVTMHMMSKAKRLQAHEKHNGEN